MKKAKKDLSTIKYVLDFSRGPSSELLEKFNYYNYDLMEAVMADKSDDSYSYRLDATGTLRSYYSPRYGCYTNILGRCISPLEMDEIVRNLNRHYKDVEKEEIEILYTSTNAAKLPLNMKPVFGYVGQEGDELNPIRVYCIRNIVVKARGYIRSFIYYNFHREDMDKEEGKMTFERILLTLPEDVSRKTAKFYVDQFDSLDAVYTRIIEENEGVSKYHSALRGDVRIIMDSFKVMEDYHIEQEYAGFRESGRPLN